MKRWSRVKRRNLLRWLTMRRMKFTNVVLSIGGIPVRQTTWVRYERWFDKLDRDAKRRLGEPE